MDVDDLLLIQKMKRGDEKAFDAFVREHYKEILNYCSYRCLDKSYAEDLTQETFLRFFKSLSDYRYMGKTRNYLYAIAGNLCRDYYKKTKENPTEEQSREFQGGSRKSEEDDVLNAIALEAAIKRLPDDLREVIILRYFQDLRLTEIARILQIGPPLVKYRIKRAKKRLEELLKEG